MNRKSVLISLVVYSFIVLILLGIFNPTGILMSPSVTPAEYLNGIPYANIFNSFILIKPSSTFFVYLLGIITILLGVSFLNNKHKIISRQYWGISMVFWGIGAILAGTSYQGLGYELKCAGNDFCEFTSWFELSYLYTTAISISILTLAIAYSCTQGTIRSIMSKIAISYIFIYGAILTIGSILENSFLISYELFTLLFMPLFVWFFILNVIEYKKKKDMMNKSLILTWLLFLLVNVLYFVFLFSGVLTTLYENTGIWFSENDVLHVALIGWMLFIWFYVKNKIIDYPITKSSNI